MVEIFAMCACIYICVCVQINICVHTSVFPQRVKMKTNGKVI